MGKRHDTSSEGLPSPEHTGVGRRSLGGRNAVGPDAEEVDSAVAPEIPQDEPDSALEERVAAKAELRSLSEELRATIERLSVAKAELQSIDDELATLDEKHRALALDAARMSTWMVDLSSGKAKTDARHSEIFELPPGADWGIETFRKRILPEHREELDRALETVMQTGRFELTVPIRRGNGGVRWIHDKGEVRHDAAGNPNRLAGVTRDVTEAKEAENALRRLNETLEDRVRERTQQVQELASNLSRAEQHERARIAQVLHDDVQQILHALQIKLAILPSAAGDEDFGEHVDEVQIMLQSAIRQTRSLTVEINPPVLHEEGLSEALRWLVAHVRDLHDLEVGLDIDWSDAPPLSNSRRVMLFHSVRELLFNVVKHGGADTRAFIRATWDGGAVCVEVWDDGAGFDPSEQLERSPGFGIANIRERLRLAGGKLAVDAAPGRGTRIVMLLPANERQDA